MELLVVLALLALLVAGLGPSFKRLREQSRTSTCSAHLRTLGIAHFSYAGENSDLIPSSDFWLADRTMLPRYALNSQTADADDPTERLSTGQVWKYLSDPKFYLCPSDTQERQRRRAAPLAITSYGANEDIRVEDPAGPLVISEGMAHLRRGSPNMYIRSGVFEASGAASGPTDGFQAEDRSAKTFLLMEEHRFNTFDDGHVSAFDEYEDALTLRHKRRGNLFFFDQHVESVNGESFNRVNAIEKLRYYFGTDLFRP
jgi:hypothetical protein